MPHISALERSDLLDEFLTQADPGHAEGSANRSDSLSTGL